MIKEFIDAYNDHSQELRDTFEEKHPDNYLSVVQRVINLLHEHVDKSNYDKPDPDRIHEIDDGDYQGTLLYVIAAGGYQPSDYWSVKVYYGSCSGCDTLQSICGYSDDNPTEEQIDDYMTLCLHIIQGLKVV